MIAKIGILLIIAIVFYVSVTAVMRLVFRKSLVTHLWTMMAPGVILMAAIAALGGKLSELGYSPCSPAAPCPVRPSSSWWAPSSSSPAN